MRVRLINRIKDKYRKKNRYRRIVVFSIAVLHYTSIVHTWWWLYTPVFWIFTKSAKCRCSISHEQHCVMQGLQNLSLQIHWEKVKRQKKFDFHLKNYSVWLFACWKFAKFSVSIQTYLIIDDKLYSLWQPAAWKVGMCAIHEVLR